MSRTARAGRHELPKTLSGTASVLPSPGPSGVGARLANTVLVLDLPGDHLRRYVERARNLVDVTAAVRHVKHVLDRCQKLRRERPARRLTLRLMQTVNYGAWRVTKTDDIADRPCECETLSLPSPVPVSALPDVNPNVVVSPTHECGYAGNSRSARKAYGSQPSSDVRQRHEPLTPWDVHDLAKRSRRPVTGRPSALGRPTRRVAAKPTSNVAESRKTRLLPRSVLDIPHPTQEFPSSSIADPGQELEQRLPAEEIGRLRDEPCVRPRYRIRVDPQRPCRLAERALVGVAERPRDTRPA